MYSARIFYSDGGKDIGKVVYKILVAVIVAFWTAFLCAVALNVAEKKFFYPLSYKDEIIYTAEKYGLDASLLFAVARVESGFNANSISAKGAVGLMQILPSTARYIAEKKGISEYDLSDVATNLDFGGYYLSYLSDRFCGLTEIAAAYNAGEGTVKSWLRDSRYSSDGLRLTEIPYAETAAYVKKICESLKRYKKLYGTLLDKTRNIG